MSFEKRTEILGGLFREHYGLVIATARRYMPVEDLVEDVVQQVFIEFVYGGADKNWDLDRNITPLLFKIVRDRALATRREIKRRRQRPIDEVIDRLDDPAPATPGELDEFLTEVDALEACLARLPRRTRQLVERHYYRGETIKSIGLAESMGFSAAYRFFQKVRSTLKACIEQSLDDAGTRDG